MKNTISIKFIALFALLLAFACKKEVVKIKGCMDKTATNYKTDAEEDDGSCTYSGKVVFWWTQAQADNWFTTTSATEVHIWENGTFQGKLVNTSVLTTAPACGAVGALTIIKDLGKSKTGTMIYQVRDQANQTWHTSDTVAVTSGGCTNKSIDR